MARSSGGWSLNQLAYVSTGPQHPAVLPDPDTQAEALLRSDGLEGSSQSNIFTALFNMHKHKAMQIWHLNCMYQHVWGCRILWQYHQPVSHTSSLKGRKVTLSSRPSLSHSTGSQCAHHPPSRKCKFTQMIILIIGPIFCKIQCTNVSNNNICLRMCVLKHTHFWKSSLCDIIKGVSSSTSKQDFCRMLQIEG